MQRDSRLELWIMCKGLDPRGRSHCTRHPGSARVCFVSPWRWPVWIELSQANADSNSGHRAGCFTWGISLGPLSTHSAELQSFSPWRCHSWSQASVTFPLFIPLAVAMQNRLLCRRWKWALSDSSQWGWPWLSGHSSCLEGHTGTPNAGLWLLALLFAVWHYMSPLTFCSFTFLICKDGGEICFLGWLWKQVRKLSWKCFVNCN